MWRTYVNKTVSGFVPISVPLFCGARSVASYPTPGSSRTTKVSRKKYNYLTNQRLVEKDKELRNRRLIRLKDDVFFHKRLNFRETVRKGVKENIRYFSEDLKTFIFFKNRGSKVVNTTFHGARKLPSWLRYRIFYQMEAEILKPANREHLIKLIESTGVKPPTAAEWERYTDKKGNININLYYHKNVNRFIRSFCLKLKGIYSYKELMAFAILKRNDFNVCPPSRNWSLSQGPLRPEEFVERGAERTKRDMATEIAQYQRPQLMKAFEKLSDAEKASFVQQVESKRKDIKRDVERERLFSAKIMCGVLALKEIRAITMPMFTYYQELYYKSIVRNGGSVSVTTKSARCGEAKWFELTKEQRLSYYCFSCLMEPNPVGGAHLYARYSTRDYGLSREAAMERWSELNDLQRAALNFCFCLPISPPKRCASSFQNFYAMQCRRHGLVMTGKACSNRAFHARVRKMWMSMSAEERGAYQDTSSFASVFPLQPQQRSITENQTHRVREESDAEAESTQLEKSGSWDNNGVGSDEVEDGYTSSEDSSFYFEDEVIEDDEEENMNDDMNERSACSVECRPASRHETSQMAFTI